MYAEKDNNDRIIIQDISPEEAEYLDDCICSYLSKKPISERDNIDKKMIGLKHQIEKLNQQIK